MRVLKKWFFEITATPLKRGTRFLRLDQPVEQTYRNLVDSVPFFEEQEDRAKDTQQGLVYAATDAEAKSFDESELSSKTKAVQPHQLPEVTSESQTISLPNGVTYSGEVVEVEISNTLPSSDKRNIYVVKINEFVLGAYTSVIQTLRSALTALETAFNAFRNLFTGGTTGQVLAKNSNGDFDFSWQSIQESDYVSFILPPGVLDYTFYVSFAFNKNTTVVFADAGLSYNVPPSVTANVVAPITVSRTDDSIAQTLIVKFS